MTCLIMLSSRLEEFHVGHQGVSDSKLGMLPIQQLNLQKTKKVSENGVHGEDFWMVDFNCEMPIF